VLLRHALAGEKLADPTKDFERGLDTDGEEIAGRLPELIPSFLRPAEIHSSPYRRCVETVLPLAAALGLHVHEDERLTPAASSSDMRGAFREVPADSVVCTHGEVIERLFDGAVTAAKGAFWIVERDRDGRLVPAQYVDAAS
jgi:phosphohistidine phosphatase SixA